MLYNFFRIVSLTATLAIALLSLSASLPASAAQNAPANPFSFTPFASESTQTLFNKLSHAAPLANPKVISLALSALDCALAQGMSSARNLTVIDYSLVSTKPRLWVFDLVTDKLLFQELVAHGMNTGKNFARNFSNTNGSHQTSLGLFLTKETYVGANGYSLRMEGLENGFNDNAMERAIVFHGADYVNLDLAKKLGHLGRSHGCPAVRRGIARKVIDTIKGEQFLFSYYPDQHWLTQSQFLNCASSQQWANNERRSNTH